MSDVQAALGLSQMKRLGRLIRQRRRLHRWYRDEGVPLATVDQPTNTDAWCAVTRHRRADTLCDWFAKHGVGASRYYRPVQHSRPFDDFMPPRPEAERAWQELVYLPSTPGLSRRHVALVARLLHEFNKLTAEQA